MRKLRLQELEWLLESTRARIQIEIVLNLQIKFSPHHYPLPLPTHDGRGHVKSPEPRQTTPALLPLAGLSCLGRHKSLTTSLRSVVVSLNGEYSPFHICGATLFFLNWVQNPKLKWEVLGNEISYIFKGIYICSIAAITNSHTSPFSQQSFT